MTSMLYYVRIYVWETGCWSLQKGLTIHEMRIIFRERALTSMDLFKIGWVFLKLWAKPVIHYFIILHHWFISNMKTLCLRFDACPHCYVFAKPTWLPKSMKFSCFVGQCSTKSNQARVVQKSYPPDKSSAIYSVDSVTQPLNNSTNWGQTISFGFGTFELEKFVLKILNYWIFLPL